MQLHRVEIYALQSAAVIRKVDIIAETGHGALDSIPTRACGIGLCIPCAGIAVLDQTLRRNGNGPGRCVKCGVELRGIEHTVFTAIDERIIHDERAAVIGLPLALAEIVMAAEPCQFLV